MSVIRDVDRAAVLRDAARELLKDADILDGHVRCECSHPRSAHDPAGWNEGWCSETDCKCEEFKAW